MKSKTLLLLSASIFLLSFFLGLDFGAFKRDYFEAHSLAMDHLHLSQNIILLLKTIPNSASGVLPLYIYGFFKSFYLRKLLSFFFFSTIAVLLLQKNNFSKTSVYISCALLISPMMISATSWVLPEVFALLSLYVLFAYTNSNIYIASITAFLVPLSRQTFVVHFFQQLFYKENNILKIVFIGFMSFLGLLLLYFIWGGLVPPKLIKVHMTPSLKPALNSLLIISLYFIPYYIWTIKESSQLVLKINYKAILISLLLIFLNLSQNDLYGGGYFFSRIEKYNIYISFILEFILLYLFFVTATREILLFTFISMLSFSTTNYMFLKYVDFYIFSFLGFTLINKQNDLKFERIAKSVFYFEIFSFFISIIYYLK
jgi:hypothetical protein